MSEGEAHRCGVVALLGRPNAGKSTLLNALLGEKIAITSARAQTTRGRILGVVTRPGVQLILADTPGIHRGQRRFNLAMTDTALEAADDADVRVVLVDAGAVWDVPEERLAELPRPLLLVRTKCDLGVPGPIPQAARDAFDEILEISALRGDGVDAVFGAIATRLPEGPALYPADYLTDRPMRFLAAEEIRGVGFELLRDELPYSLAVEVEQWQESADDLRIRANLLVERESQKGMVVGQGGQMLKALGVESRKRLRDLIGKTVHLNLWVKTDKNWTKRPARARELGYLR